MPFTEPNTAAGQGNFPSYDIMKPFLKLFVLLSIGLFAIQTATAQEDSTTTLKQKQIQTEIFDHLNNEGFRPDIDEVGDLTFKENGTRYWIVTKVDEVGVGTRIIFFTNFRLPEKTKLSKLSAICNYVNLKLCTIKSDYDLNCNTVKISVETWIQNSSDFTKLFITYLIGLQAAEEIIFDEIG